MTQQDLADSLSQSGHETSYARVSHWERGRNKPPLENPAFRMALATALQTDVNDMMSELGFVVTDEQRSRNALLAADLMDQMPEEAQLMALDIISSIKRRYEQAAV
jgi:transcriptional regulator with XRE-family HTH domain